MCARVGRGKVPKCEGKHNIGLGNVEVVTSWLLLVAVSDIDCTYGF